MWNFVAIKIHRPRPGLNQRTLDPVAARSIVAVLLFSPLRNPGDPLLVGC
jgi:hypothetical protein